MLKSMTGYGSANTDFEKARYTIEIKSLNSKFLELSVKLPKIFSDKEFFIRNECTKLIERGKVNIQINVENKEASNKAAVINTDLLKQYYLQLKAVDDELGANNQNLLSAALNLPEVISFEEDAISEEEWQQVLKAFYIAVNNFQQFRADEGRVLEEEIIHRIKNILSLLSLIEVEEPNRVIVYKERLNQYLREAVGTEIIDKNRFEQELIYYIDKLDITEEKVRLKSHCEYFIQSLKEQEAGGKKLGFISQEIGREVNTMGSKAYDAEMQKLVVGMKEELEKIKEQLLNVL